MHKKLAIAAAVVAIAATEGVGLAVGAPPIPLPGGYVGTTPPSQDLSETTEPQGRLPVAAIEDRLGVLTAATQRRDAMTSIVANSPILEDGIVDVAQAHSVPAAGARATWIAPSRGDDAVCQVSAGELNCPSADTLAERGAAPARFKHVDSPYRVTGIALDDVKQVTIIRADGSTIDVGVDENFFSYEDEQAPTGVRWVGPRGAEEQMFRPMS